MRQYDSYRASQPAYVHGSAAPDLRRQGNPDVNKHARTPQWRQSCWCAREHFGVVSVVFAVAIVIAIFACARVLLSAASVTTTIATDELSTQSPTSARSAMILRCSREPASNSTHICPRLRASEWRRLPLPKASSLAPTSLRPTLRATFRFPEACLLWQAKARCDSCLATRAVRRRNIPSAQIALGCSWAFWNHLFVARRTSRPASDYSCR